MNRRFRGLMFTVPGLVLGAVGAWSCGNVKDLPSDVSDLAPDCAFTCDGEGVTGGHASISGTPSIDAFFGSVVRFNAAADLVSSSIQTELDAIATSVGANRGDSADLKAKLTGKINESVSGGLNVTFQPPECSVSAKAILVAQAKCAGSVVPPTASVKCEGTCTADASAQVDCGADATLSCTGVAPNLACSGTCKGECELGTPATCEGTCKGTCAGTCTLRNAAGNCAGTCSGTCQGSCRLDAPSTCNGSCKGECTYTPPSGQCDATAEAHCDAKAGGQIDCQGTCSGNVTPPAAKAECDASAKAEASVSTECTPPALNVAFQLTPAAAGDAQASAEFQAWLEGFKGHVAAILALRAKLDVIANAGADIAATAEGAIKGSIEIAIKGHLSLVEVVFLGCALTELPKAMTLVKEAGTKLQASAAAAVDVLGTVGVS